MERKRLDLIWKQPFFLPSVPVEGDSDYWLYKHLIPVNKPNSQLIAPLKFLWSWSLISCLDIHSDIRSPLYDHTLQKYLVLYSVVTDLSHWDFRGAFSGFAGIISFRAMDGDWSSQIRFLLFHVLLSSKKGPFSRKMHPLEGGKKNKNFLYRLIKKFSLFLRAFLWRGKKERKIQYSLLSLYSKRCVIYQWFCCFHSNFLPFPFAPCPYLIAALTETDELPSTHIPRGLVDGP